MAMKPRGNQRTNARQGLAALVILAVVFVACGIGFSDEFEGTELLKDVIIEEPVVSGRLITIFLDYASQYPSSVEVRCDLLSTEDVPTVTPLATSTVSPAGLRRTPEPTLPAIPLVRPTPKNKVLKLLMLTIPAHDDGGPTGTATPVLATVERHFVAPEPGEYVVWCYTPLDLNNAIFQELTVLPREDTSG